MRKFHANALFSLRGFSQYEFGFSRALFGMVSETYPEYETRFGDAALVWHSTAELVNSTFMKRALVLVHLDAEFMRLAEVVSDVFEGLYDQRDDQTEWPEGAQSRIVDRMIFHAGIRSGTYDLLPGLPLQEELPAMSDRNFEWSIYQASFILAHELAHVEMFHKPDLVAPFRSLGVQLYDDERAKQSSLHLLQRLQNDYAYLIARQFRREHQEPRAYRLADLKDLKGRHLAEFYCDLTALAVTTRVARRIGELGGNPWRRFLALFALQCTQLLWEISHIVLSSRPWLPDGRMTQFEVLHEASLRQLSLTVFMVHGLQAAVGEEASVERGLLRSILIRNNIVASCTNDLCRRVVELSAKANALCPGATRDLIEAWGYRADRISKVLFRGRAIARVDP